MDIITNLKSINTKSDWKKCLNPDHCFAFINRQKEKEKVRAKRKLETEPEKNVADDQLGRPYNNAGSTSNTFRVSCRIRGEWKKYLNPISLAKTISEHIIKEKKWMLCNNSPELDIYVNINDECIIAGRNYKKI